MTVNGTNGIIGYANASRTGGGGKIMGDFLTSRENAGAALIQAYKDLFTDHAKEIGSSRDFPLYPEY